jgi:hypothetical protein
MTNSVIEVFWNLPLSVQKVLQKNNALLLGGSVLSKLLGLPVKDYDLFFERTEDLSNCIAELKTIGIPKFESDSILTFKLWNEFEIQCVLCKVGSLSFVFGSFDFKFCQIGIRCRDLKVSENEMSLQEIVFLEREISAKKRLHKPSDNDWDEVTVNSAKLEDINPKRLLKYEEKNLLSISVDSLIQHCLDSNTMIPAQLMNRTNKLWITGYVKSWNGDLYPPSNSGFAEEEDEDEDEDQNDDDQYKFLKHKRR